MTFAAGFPLGRREYVRTDSTAEGFLTLVNWQATENWKLRLILAAHSSLHFILPEIWNWGSDGKALTITNDRLYIDGWNIARGWPLERDLFALWDNRLELRLMESAMTSSAEISESVTITLRMDPRMLARIKRLARSRYLNYQSMIKQWLSERMEQELRERAPETRGRFLS